MKQHSRFLASFGRREGEGNFVASAKRKALRESEQRKQVMRLRAVRTLMANKESVAVSPMTTHQP